MPEDSTPPLREGPLLQVFVAGQLTAHLLRAHLATMTADQFAVLSVIGILEPLTPGELARRLGMAPTTVSSWLARLERDGLAARRPNPDDGRSQLVELTPEGGRRLREEMPHFRRAIDRVREELGTDLPDVAVSLDRLVAALRAVVAETTSS